MVFVLVLFFLLSVMCFRLVVVMMNGWCGLICLIVFIDLF